MKKIKLTILIACVMVIVLALGVSASNYYDWQSVDFVNNVNHYITVYKNTDGDFDSTSLIEFGLININQEGSDCVYGYYNIEYWHECLTANNVDSLASFEAFVQNMVDTGVINSQGGMYMDLKYTAEVYYSVYENYVAELNVKTYEDGIEEGKVLGVTEYKESEEYTNIITENTNLKQRVSDLQTSLTNYEHSFTYLDSDYFVERFNVNFVTSIEYAKYGRMDAHFDLLYNELYALLSNSQFLDTSLSAVEYLGLSYTDSEATGINNYFYFIRQNYTNENLEELFNAINHVGGDLRTNAEASNGGSDSELEAENEALRAEIDSLNTSVETLRSKLDSANGEAEYYEKLYNDEAESNALKDVIIAARNQQITELQEEVDTLEESLKEGGNEAYLNGFNDGLESSDTFKDTLVTMFSSPTYIFSTIFDFELFGINFYQIIKVIITAMVVIFIVKIFI